MPSLETYGDQGRAAAIIQNVVERRTPFSEEALRTDRIDAIIAQDPGHAVRSAVRIMRARADLRDPIAAQEKIRIEVFAQGEPFKSARPTKV